MIRWRRRRGATAAEPSGLRSLDVGHRIVGHRFDDAAALNERLAAELDTGHPHRQAALELCSDAAVRALRATFSPGARRHQPLRLVLTIAPTGVRIELRGAGIDETVGDRQVADRLATRWGTTHERHGCTLWYELGEIDSV